MKGEWDDAGKWYSECVGEKGHYYHQTVILPRLHRLFGWTAQVRASLLDLGCGQGILARHIPAEVSYWGLDNSPSLLAEAKKMTKRKEAHFLLGDACGSLDLKKKDFDAACFLLSLQNMAEPEKAIANAGAHLKKGGTLLLVLNHPCFRIPRQSAWGVDEKAHLQYRRMNSYMSPQKIPIQTHPGKKGADITTYSYHFPLSSYMAALASAKFCIAHLEEWCSDKKSEGGSAKREDRARKEFPLFLAILAKKIAEE